MNEIEVLIHQYDKHGSSQQRLPLSVTMSELEKNALSQYETELKCKRTQLIHVFLDAVVHGNIHFACNSENPDIIEIFTLANISNSPESDTIVKASGNNQQTSVIKQQQLKIEELRIENEELKQELNIVKSEVKQLQQEVINFELQQPISKPNVEIVVKEYAEIPLPEKQKLTINNVANSEFQEIMCRFASLLLGEKRQLLQLDRKKDEFIQLVTSYIINNSILNKPIVNKPIVNRPIVNEPIVNKPIVNELIVNEPIVNEPIVNEPIVNKPIVNEPIVNELIVNELIVNEPIVNEPIVEGLWAATYNTDCQFSSDSLVKVETSNSFYLIRSCLSVLEYVSLLNKDSTQLKVCVESLISFTLIGEGINNLDSEVINGTLEEALGYVQDIYKKLTSS